MLSYPQIPPYFLKIGSLELRWYGLMYALSFVVGYFVLRKLLEHKRFRNIGIDRTDIYDLLFFVLLGVVIGGRLGYVLFYNLSYYIQNPASILAVWQGGMSFHGGLVGVLVASILFCRFKKIKLLDLGDLLAVATPIGLGLGRLGNFINGELYGRVTDVPWCMTFPGADGCRHPSQLYEFLLEGVVMFGVLWFLKNKKKPSGFIIFSFLILYGIFRIFIEFFREPDQQLGLIFSNTTMGQLLSIPLIVIGVIGIFWSYKKEQHA